MLRKSSWAAKKICFTHVIFTAQHKKFTERLYALNHYKLALHRTIYTFNQVHLTKIY